jgi:hypothetical protein
VSPDAGPLEHAYELQKGTMHFEVREEVWRVCGDVRLLEEDYELQKGTLCLSLC